MAVSNDPIYTHTDGSLYHAVTIKKGDTIGELAVQKGYSYNKAHKIYYSKVNEEAPNAVKAGSDPGHNSIQPGKIFYIPIRNAAVGQSVTHTINNATFSVRCVYADTPSEPLRHRFVLFWELNENETDFNKVHKYIFNKWERNVANIPVGYGVTDGDGVLSSISDIRGFDDHKDTKSVSFNYFMNSFKGMKIVKSKKGNKFYHAPGGSNVEPIFTNSIGSYEKQPMLPMRYGPDAKVCYIWEKNVSKFPMNKKLVFMIMPADIGNGFFTENLLKISSEYVWKGKLCELPEQESFRQFYMLKDSYRIKNMDNFIYISKNENYSNDNFDLIKEKIKQRKCIELPCFLPEWAARIKQRKELFLDAVNQYHEIIKPHLESIAQLDLMSEYIIIVSKFPDHKQKKEEFENLKNLYKKVEHLKKVISDEFIKNRKNKARPCKRALDYMNQRSEELIELLENPAIIVEFDKFLDQIEQDDFEGWPYRDKKGEWFDIFCKELGSAYTALKNAEEYMLDSLFEKHIEPVFKIWANAVDENDEAYRRIIKKYPGYPIITGFAEPVDKPTDEELKIPLVHITDKLFSIKNLSNISSKIYALITTTEGTPSLMVALINGYGMLWSKRFNHLHILIDAKASGKALKSLYGILRWFNGKQDDNFDILVHQIVYGGRDFDMKSNQFKDTIYEAMDLKGKPYAAKAFQGVMVMFSVICLIANITDDEQETVRRWIAISGSFADFSTVSIGFILARYSSKLWFRVATVGFGALACLIGGVLNYWDSEAAESQGDETANMLNKTAFAGSSLLLIGYTCTELGIISILGLSTAFIVLVGSIVSIAPMLALLFRELVLVKGTESVFLSLRSQFSKKEGLYEIQYSQVPIIELAYKNIGQSNRFIWCNKLSWRAIAPLYELFFSNKNGSKPQNEKQKYCIDFFEKLTVYNVVTLPPPEFEPIDCHVDYSEAHRNEIINIIGLFNFYKQSSKNNDLIELYKWIDGSKFPDKSPEITV